MSDPSSSAASHRPFGIVLHGGAGDFSSYLAEAYEFSPPKTVREEFLKVIPYALSQGYEILANQGKAVDAVETVVKILEDHPLFNAGRGSVRTSKGTLEMDAAITSTEFPLAGSVAGLSTAKNPITVARKLMEGQKHVMLVGNGAESFALASGCETKHPDYFWTKRIERRLKENAALKDKKGTVGAVALDIFGNLAAGTSTGGMWLKEPGRVGDSPVISAGTYADKFCAVSCTGHGEYFIQLAMAHNVASAIEYGRMSLSKAARISIERLNRYGIDEHGVPKVDGGLIAIDPRGEVAVEYNSKGMLYGFMVNRKGQVEQVIQIENKASK